MDDIIRKRQLILARYIDKILPLYFGDNLHVFEKVHFHFLGTFISREAIHSPEFIPSKKWSELKRELSDRQTYAMFRFYKKYFDRSLYEIPFESLSESIVSFNKMGFLEFWDGYEPGEQGEASLLFDMYYDGFCQPLRLSSSVESNNKIYSTNHPFPFLFLKTRCFPSPEFNDLSAIKDEDDCNEFIYAFSLEESLDHFSQNIKKFANDVLHYLLENPEYKSLLLEIVKPFKRSLPSTDQVQISLSYIDYVSKYPWYFESYLARFYRLYKRTFGYGLKSEADFKLYVELGARLATKEFLEEIFTNEKIFNSVWENSDLESYLVENKSFCWSCFGTPMRLKHHKKFFDSNVSICQECYEKFDSN